MHTLGDMAKALNRSAVYLHGVQARFELPTMVGSGYPEAYLSFLRTVVFLRILNVSEESLRDLWHIERKLLQLLHVDSTGSSTWFLDSCGASTHPERRLLLTNHDMGVALPSRTLQLGLNFAADLPELFAGKEMGKPTACNSRPTRRIRNVSRCSPPNRPPLRLRLSIPMPPTPPFLSRPGWTATEVAQRTTRYET